MCRKNGRAGPRPQRPGHARRSRAAAPAPTHPLLFTVLLVAAAAALPHAARAQLLAKSAPTSAAPAAATAPAPAAATASTAAAAAAGGAAPVPVSNPAELLAAINGGTAAAIHLMRPMVLPEGWGPARVARPLLIMSPYRVVLDWCDAACRASPKPAPKIILEEGAAVAWNRVFFRNFLPPAPRGAAGAARRGALLAPRTAAAVQGAVQEAPDLDWKSPTPFVMSRGGSATYNLIVWHFQPAMQWAFEEPSTYWAAAIAGTPPAMQNMVGRTPYDPTAPVVYNIKSFALGPVGAIQECYIPVDVNGCFGAEGQPDEQLIYCPYTFKDSLKNPWLRKVFIFHDIGLDRLVNTYRNPVLVTRPVTYQSCRGTVHIMDMDNITASVLVGSGGALTMTDMILQGSKSQATPGWPSRVPLLLSAIRVVDSGVVTLRSVVVRVPNLGALVQELNALPGGTITAPEVPDLRPAFSGRPPAPGAKSFTIQSWQLDSKRWAQWTRADALPAAVSQWVFFNVTVEQYSYPNCFHGAMVLGTATPGSVAKVTTGEQLLQQLNNNTARYIQLMKSIRIPPDTPPSAVTVSRIVEVRACSPGGSLTGGGGGQTSGLYEIDWSGVKGAVEVSGNLIFNGDIIMTGLGWDRRGGGGAEAIVAALEPQGPGSVVEFEDLAMTARMPPDLAAGDGGQGEVQRALRLPPLVRLDGMPANFTLRGPNTLAFRQFYLNRSASIAPGGAASGATGTLSFIDTTLTWRAAGDAAGDTLNAAAGGGRVPAAAIVIPVVLGLVGLGAVVTFVFWRKHRAAQALLLDAIPQSDAKGGSGTGGFAIRRHPSSAYEEGGKTDPNGLTRYPSMGSKSETRGSARSGPSEEIQAACRSLVSGRPTGEEEEMQLHSVLGEGSYGKVYKGSWRGSPVAIKVMILPAAMSGKERREKMAVMETAISSSLSHPNIVQTFTYSIKSVKSSTSRSEAPSANPPGTGHHSVHDSSASVSDKAAAAAAAAGGAPGTGLGTGSDVHSWELRLVQEYCDLGSLRDALSTGLFKSPGQSGGAAGQSGGHVSVGGGGAGAVVAAPGGERSVDMAKVLGTALDVARAMAHLHAQSILHSDLKARNILLKSSPTEGRGFVAKVADFGLSMEIDPHDTHVSGAFQGTITHMAPELLLSGRISKASDVYAFAILLWELYTGGHAYAGMPRALLGHSITKQGLRPEFPGATPFEYKFLACRCWETDPLIRPSFIEILRELERMQSRLTGAQTGSPREFPISGDGGGSGNMSDEHLVLGPAAVAAATGLPGPGHAGGGGGGGGPMFGRVGGGGGSGSGSGGIFDYGTYTSSGGGSTGGGGGGSNGNGAPGALVGPAGAAALAAAGRAGSASAPPVAPWGLPVIPDDEHEGDMSPFNSAPVPADADAAAAGGRPNGNGARGSGRGGGAQGAAAAPQAARCVNGGAVAAAVQAWESSSNHSGSGSGAGMGTIIGSRSVYIDGDNGFGSSTFYGPEAGTTDASMDPTAANGAYGGHFGHINGHGHANGVAVNISGGEGSGGTLEPLPDIVPLPSPGRGGGVVPPSQRHAASRGAGDGV